MVVGLDVANSMTGVGTFLTGLAACGGIFHVHRRQSQVVEKLDTVDRNTNGELNRLRVELAAATAELERRGISPPPIPGRRHDDSVRPANWWEGQHG
jgi:hypothetical protein